MRSRQPAKRGEGRSPASWVGLNKLHPNTKMKMNRCLAVLPQQLELKGSAQADDGREPVALYAFAVGSRLNGGKAEARPRGKDANSSQTITNEPLGYNATATPTEWMTPDEP